MSSGNGRNGNGSDVGMVMPVSRASEAQASGAPRAYPGIGPLHPAWASFIEFCHRLGHGEIERIKIQDGLPALAEVTTKKVKFS